ncbi:MAG: hypothetical protein JNL97_07680 [Verrucomicrobiales bacterium]|nr:hypothetical protein [Verrucomicrobiales bacterium]
MPREGTTAILCTTGGLLLMLAGLFVPAHFRAVDSEVLRVAGEGSPSLADLAAERMAQGQVSSAGLLFRAGRRMGSGDRGSAEAGVQAVAEGMVREPGVRLWGSTNAWLDACCGAVAKKIGEAESVDADPEAGVPVLSWVLPGESRRALLQRLQSSSDPAVIALLAARKLEKTSILPPVASSSGQPLDAGLLLASVLAEQQRGRAGVVLEFERGAMAATQGRGSEPLETLVLDLLAAARHLDWDRLASLMDRCESGTTLHRLVEFSRGEESRWVTLLGLIAANGGGQGIGEFLAKHGEEGWKDLERATGMGAGSVQALVKGGVRIHDGRWRGWVVRATGAEKASRWVAGATFRAPTMALVVRYLLWLDGLFLTILGLWWGRRMFVTETNRRFQPRPDLVSVGVVAATVAIGIFLASERFLGLQRGAAAGRAASGLPVLKARLRFDLPPATNSLMNEKVIGMLVLFFVIQFAIYLIGLSRLRHIRGQGVDGGVKLKLLDNEESMFDAPLYVGIAGSVLALVLRISNFGDVSLMASYSSTLFGILFCFILKVMHVRPYRQQLILEASERVPS